LKIGRGESGIQDRGRSAFHGHHFERGESKGALGQFVQLVKDGTVQQGSILLIEHLDRVSRLQTGEGYARVTDLLNHGIEIVTLLDGEHYTASRVASDIGRLLKLIMLLFQSHEESAKKSYRSKANWAQKIKMAREQKVRISKRCPSWIEPETGALIPDKADVVRSCFAMALEGKGVRQIAKQLSTNGVLPIGKAKAWHSGLVNQYLQSRTVLGEYQPCRIVNGRKIPDGEPIEDYYPRLIGDEIFRHVQLALKKRTWLRGRINHNANLFVGTARSLLTDTPLHHSRQIVTANGKQYDHEYLISYSRLQGWTDSKEVAVNYRTFEAAFFSAVSQIDPAKILATDDRAAIELQAAQYTLAEINEQMDNTRKKIKINKKSVALLDLLVEQEAERDVLAAKVDQLRTVTFSSQSKLFDEIKAMMHDPANRAKVSSNMRLLIDKVHVLTIPLRRGQHRKIQYYAYVEAVFHTGRSVHYITDQDGDLLPKWAPSLEIYNGEFVRRDQVRLAYCQSLIKYYAGDEWRPGLEAWLKTLPATEDFGGSGNIDSFVYSISHPVEHVLDISDGDGRDFLPDSYIDPDAHLNED
jgi:DNA invertase Pin-like site-specific DNA recombinase